MTRSFNDGNSEIIKLESILQYHLNTQKRICIYNLVQFLIFRLRRFRLIRHDELIWLLFPAEYVQHVERCASQLGEWKGMSKELILWHLFLLPASTVVHYVIECAKLSPGSRVMQEPCIASTLTVLQWLCLYTRKQPLY